MALPRAYANSLLLANLAPKIDVYTQSNYAKNGEDATDNAVLSNSLSILTQLIAWDKKRQETCRKDHAKVEYKILYIYSHNIATSEKGC